MLSHCRPVDVIAACCETDRFFGRQLLYESSHLWESQHRPFELAAAARLFVPVFWKSELFFRISRHWRGFESRDCMYLLYFPHCRLSDEQFDLPAGCLGVKTQR